GTAAKDRDTAPSLPHQALGTASTNDHTASVGKDILIGMNILALDVGTSAVQAAILDVSSGRAIGKIAGAPYTLGKPVPDAAEVRAPHLWQTVATSARAAVLPSGVEGSYGQDIAGVGLSCMTPALLLLDKSDRPLAPIRTHLDRRARPAARQVWASLGE